MSRIRCFLIPALLLVARISVAQSPVLPSTPRAVTLYYNSQCELTTPEKAYFIRETSLDFENILFSGVTKDYLSSNHTLIAEGYFDRGVNHGLHSDYFENGKLESTIEYSDNGFILWEFTDAQNNLQVTRGTGKFVLECYSINSVANSGVTLGIGTVSGEFKNGKRVGTWIYRTKAGIKTDEENYDKEHFSRIAYNTDGMSTNTADKKQIIISLTGLLTEAFSFDTSSFPFLNDYFVKECPAYPSDFRRWITYPGGMKKILLILARGLATQLAENITIKITVDQNGKFQGVRTGVFGFGGEVKSILQIHETRFLPAVMNGKPYSFTMKIPLGNSPQWINYLETATDDDVNAYLDELNAEN